MLVNPHRVATLITLADLERRVTGPERMLRESDVAALVKAAYDDAMDPARAAFMARIQPMPVAAWPWSAVQVKAVRSSGGGGAAAAGGRAIGAFAPNATAVIPPALLLIRGEAESADAEPGSRLPERGTPEGAAWEPLHRALDSWDTATITRWIGPQGWILPNGAAMGQSAPTGGEPSRPPSGGSPDAGIAPIDSPTSPTAFSWRSPTAIAIGTTVASTLGIVLFSLRRRREPAPATTQEKP